MTLPLLATGILLAAGACSASPEPELSILGQTPAQLPVWVTETEGLPLEDLTHVADADHLRVFASRDAAGNWCVLLAIEPTDSGTDWVASASCAPASTFATEGVFVEATVHSGRSGSAWLLPDNFGGEAEDGWERVHDNLTIRS